MEILQGYFNTKKESYRWLMIQIENIARDIRAQANEKVEEELRRIGDALQNASKEEIEVKVGQMAKHHHVHLQNIVELFIISMRNLSLALKNQLTSFRPPINTIPTFTNSVPLLPSSYPPASNSHSKVERPSPQKFIQPFYTLTMSDKPNISTSVKEIPRIKTKDEEDREIKQQLQQKKLKHLDLMRASKKRNEEQQQRRQIRKQGGSVKKEIQHSNDGYARSCLQLDHKIYNEANQFLNNVLKNKSRGITPLKNSFLQRSPITKLQISRKIKQQQ